MFACIPKRCSKVSIAEQKKGAVVQVDITVNPASCLPAEKVVMGPTLSKNHFPKPYKYPKIYEIPSTIYIKLIAMSDRHMWRTQDDVQAFKGQLGHAQQRAFEANPLTKAHKPQTQIPRKGKKRSVLLETSVGIVLCAANKEIQEYLRVYTQRDQPP